MLFVLTVMSISCASILCHLCESLDISADLFHAFCCLPGYLMAPVLVFIFLLLLLQWPLLGPCFNVTFV